MNKDQLFEIINKKYLMNEVHPLLETVIEECCEKAIELQHATTNEDDLVLAVEVCFLGRSEYLKKILDTAFKKTSKEAIVLEYRGVDYIINKESKVYNYLCENIIVIKS